MPPSIGTTYNATCNLHEFTVIRRGIQSFHPSPCLSSYPTYAFGDICPREIVRINVRGDFKSASQDDFPWDTIRRIVDRSWQISCDHVLPRYFFTFSWKSTCGGFGRNGTGESERGAATTSATSIAFFGIQKETCIEGVWCNQLKRQGGEQRTTCIIHGMRSMVMVQ